MHQIYVISGNNYQQQQMRNISAVQPLQSSVQFVQSIPMVMVPPQQYHQSQLSQNSFIVFNATEQNGFDPHANYLQMNQMNHIMNPMVNYHPPPTAAPAVHCPPSIGSNPLQHSVNIKNDLVNIPNANRLPLEPSPILFNHATTSNNNANHRIHSEDEDHAQREGVISLSELKQQLKQISCDTTSTNSNDNKPFSVTTPYRSSPSTNSTVSNNADYSNINMLNSSNSATARASSSANKSGRARVYECLYCNHKFKQSHSLKDHIRTHTGEKPYECSYCSRRFKVKYNMIVHTRIHTGVKPYGCEVCAKRYASKSGLNAHFKKHHPAEWNKSKLLNRK